MHYSEYEHRSGEKSRRGVMMFLLDTILGLLTFVVAVGMALTCIAPWINPGFVWVFSILGLAAPAIYIVTFTLLLYWVIRWRWGYVVVLLVLVVVGLFNVSLFYNPGFKRIYAEPTYERSVFKVMTYNVRSFYGENHKSSAKDILKLIDEQDPDIICMQEFNAGLMDGLEEFDAMREKYECADGSPASMADSMHITNLLVFSKFRILQTGTIIPRTSIWVDVLIQEDTVRVFCNHLRSTALKSSDDEFITNHHYLSDTARQVKIRSIVQRFRDNSILRAAQVDSIALEMEGMPSCKIVCGDFNDTPMSYVYRTMAGGLNDAFREKGRGYSHTFRGFYNMLRIDFVLSSDGFENISYEVSDVNYSDHHPVLVRLKKVNNVNPMR